MADEELELDVTQPKGNKMVTILLIVVIVLVLIIGGVGAWLFLGSGSSDDAASDSGATEEKQLGPITYLTLVPEFVVNFGPTSKVRYLQVDIQIASRDEHALQMVNTYRPVIRNDILVLLSGLSFAELKVRAGKEALQKNILNTINTIVSSVGHDAAQAETKENAHETEQGKNDATDVVIAADKEQVHGPIENVYFTSFIMQ